MQACMNARLHGHLLPSDPFSDPFLAMDGGADGEEVAGELLELLVMVGHHRRDAVLLEAVVAGGEVRLHRVEVGVRRVDVAALERVVHRVQARLDVAVRRRARVQRVLGRPVHARRVHPVRRRVHRHDHLLPHRLHGQLQHAHAVRRRRRRRPGEPADRRLAVHRVLRLGAHALDHRAQELGDRLLDHPR
ncbi:hypothetical protein BDA96_05G228500 [Sorghum bicolor]|uniref:Uncharacterized protein n=1 Tax=Sorghum bicolor TaxID=4558 RepID=A0A921R1U4_SORBI|nr:hypothetical protein BDA96_05G228500 [Sorghum bicolor]